MIFGLYPAIPKPLPRNRTPDGISDGLDSDGDGMRDGLEVLRLKPQL